MVNQEIVIGVDGTQYKRSECAEDADGLWVRAGGALALVKPSAAFEARRAQEQRAREAEAATALAKAAAADAAWRAKVAKATAALQADAALPPAVKDVLLEIMQREQA